MQRKDKPIDFSKNPFGNPNMGEMGNGTKSFVTLTESGSSIKEKPENCL